MDTSIPLSQATKQRQEQVFHYGDAKFILYNCPEIFLQL